MSDEDIRAVYGTLILEAASAFAVDSSYSAAIILKAKAAQDRLDKKAADQ